MCSTADVLQRSRRNGRLPQLRECKIFINDRFGHLKFSISPASPSRQTLKQISSSQQILIPRKYIFSYSQCDMSAYKSVSRGFWILFFFLFSFHWFVPLWLAESSRVFFFYRQCDSDSWRFWPWSEDVTRRRFNRWLRRRCRRSRHRRTPTGRSSRTRRSRSSLRSSRTCRSGTTRTSARSSRFCNSLSTLARREATRSGERIFFSWHFYSVFWFSEFSRSRKPHI